MHSWSWGYLNWQHFHCLVEKLYKFGLMCLATNRHVVQPTLNPPAMSALWLSWGSDNDKPRESKSLSPWPFSPASQSCQYRSSHIDVDQVNPTIISEVRMLNIRSSTVTNTKCSASVLLWILSELVQQKVYVFMCIQMYYVLWYLFKLLQIINIKCQY